MKNWSMLAAPPYGSPPDEVHVERLQIRRRISPPRHDVVAEAIDVGGEDRLDAIGIGVADGLVPLPIRWSGDRAARVALDAARCLRKLDPQDARPLGAARRVERVR